MPPYLVLFPKGKRALIAAGLIYNLWRSGKHWVFAVRLKEGLAAKRDQNFDSFFTRNLE